MTLRALYVDFNSYFASVEQQERPELRGKPIGVLPVLAETTCCIAASYEAKAFGVKTGTRVSDARKMCPGMIFVEARPRLYVEYHHSLIDIVESCTHVEKILSIDEMVCKLTGSQQKRENSLTLAQSIKDIIAKKAGSQIRSSIGIAPNTFLAKIASNMQKPDGCVVIEQNEVPERLYPLELRSLYGIGRRMEQRLSRHHIHSVEQLYAVNRQEMRAIWGGVGGEHYYDRLRGVELLEINNARSSLNQSHVLAPELRSPKAALAVLHRLLQKACLRLRSYQLYTSNISITVRHLDGPGWIIDSKCSPTDDTLILTNALEQLWENYPVHKNPYKVGLSLMGLRKGTERTLDLFQPEARIPERALSATLDKLNMRFGKNTVYFGGAHNALNNAPMRIAFNHIPDLNVEGDGSQKGGIA
jgi:DNA polymerase IV